MTNKSLNPTWHICQRSSVLKAIGLYSKGWLFDPTVRLYFSSNNVRLLAYVFTGEGPKQECIKRD